MGPVESGFRIRRTYQCRGVRLSAKSCPILDTKLSDGEAPVLECFGIWSTPLLPSLPGPFSNGVVLLVRVSSLAKRELSNHLLALKPFMLNRITSVR